MGAQIKVKTDPIFKGIVATLLITGFFILASASIGITTSMKAPPYYFILRQITMGGAAGLILFIFAAKFPYKKWKTWALAVFLGSILLTSAVWIPGFGLKAGGALRWIDLGLLSFQPSEFLKFGFILYLSAWFSSRGGRISSLKNGLIPFLIITGVASSLLVL
ncbi:MAG: Stage V sporulation protein e, partial [Candidatus Giovannonibacteria bacterium GW2011_GWB1_45_9b]